MKVAPRATVNARPNTSWLRWFLIRAQCAQVSVAPEVNNSNVLRAGMPQAFMGVKTSPNGPALGQAAVKPAYGVYGATFFILTGFHGLHVTLGTIMLLVILGRCIKGHFSEHNHFAFEAVAWYWHFVDVVWLIVFVFVYWI